LVDRWSRVPPGRGCRRIPPSLHLIARGSAARYGLEFDRTPVGSTPLLVPLVPTERPRSRDAQVLDLGRGTEGSNPVPSSRESVSLPHPLFEGREPRLSARVCAAGLASGSAETRGAFRYRANWRQYLCRAIFQYRSAADVVARMPRRCQRSRPFSGPNVGSSLNSDRAQPKPSMVR
jgi:hypothetical protein